MDFTPEPRKKEQLWLGLLAGLATYLLCVRFLELEEPVCRMAGIGVWIAWWWVTEAINIYFTALLPVVLFPFLGILEMKALAPLYMKDIIFLFIGAFLIAYALERWNLHQRIALKIIVSIGHTPARILLGFMLASWFLSMWILNTATVSMLIPAAIAVIRQMEARNPNGTTALAKPYLIGIAYASSIGGIATLIGTAPNMVFRDLYNEHFSSTREIDFTSWFVMGFPVSVLLFLVCFLLLRFQYRKAFAQEKIDREASQKAYTNLGRISREEVWVLILFVLTILLWFTRKGFDFGSFKIPGWSALLDEKNFIKESTVAMLTALVLFLIPSRKQGGGGLLRWKDVERLPLGVLFLFGGGFALAEGFKVSGLSDLVGEQLRDIGTWSPVLIVLVLCMFMTFFTELTSNTASTLLILPILISVAGFVEMSPLQLLVPVTFSASCAFMLPVATPPNTIVFGSNRLRIADMMRSGIWMNLAGVTIITMLTFILL